MIEAYYMKAWPFYAELLKREHLKNPVDELKSSWLRYLAQMPALQVESLFERISQDQPQH